MKKYLYFAYGSNLNFSDLTDWCYRNNQSIALIPKVSTGFIPDTKLVFNYYSFSRQGGTLNIQDCLGHATPGVLFEVSESDLAVLDKKEGAPYCYERIQTIAITPDGYEYDVVTYRVIHENTQEFVQPSKEYLNIVMEGYSAHGLDTSFLISSAQHNNQCITDKLFVYGTLMQGECRNGVLLSNDAHCIGLGKTNGTLVDLGSFPGMILSENHGHNPVLGELYQLKYPDRILAILDQIEGFNGFGDSDSLYRRVLIHVTEDGGRKMLAWFYVFNQDIDNYTRLIPSGNWKDRS